MLAFAGAGLAGRDPNLEPGRELIGGEGSGADGGGAGGPKPTTGRPRSSSGSDDPLGRRCTLIREPGLLTVGIADCERDFGRGVGMSSSSFGGGSPKSRPLKESIADAWEAASRVTLLAEREGLRPRMGAVGVATGRTASGPVEFRTEERKGAGSERTCMLVGRRRVRMFACACACAAVGDAFECADAGGVA